MALILYSQMLFFPGGNPASNYPVTIRPRASNQNALLFADAAGTTATTNPKSTDINGVISFYAAPGDYIAYLGGEESSVGVDASVTEPVWPNLYIHTQSEPGSVWTIDHRFGVQPEVQIFTASGEVADASVVHPSTVQTVITFSAAQTGTAHLRR